MKEQNDTLTLHQADLSDLVLLRPFFAEVVRWMRHSGITIWNDVYPACMLEEDVKRKRLWHLCRGDAVVAAFALPRECVGENAVAWQRESCAPRYLYRLAVLPEAARSGIGSQAVMQAAAIARSEGADSLRLFVAEDNRAAVRFYLKNGFLEADGVYVDPIAGDPLRERGFELPL